MLLLCYFWQKRTSINILLQLCFSAIATFISTYTYKIGNGNPIPPKSKKSNKTDFYRIYILYVYCMYVCSSSRILLKATAENSCEGFRSSFTYPLLLSLSLFFMLKILCKRSKLLKSWILTIMDQFFNRNSFVCNEGLFN